MKLLKAALKKVYNSLLKAWTYVQSKIYIRRTPVRYFDGIVNVGDLLNRYTIQYLSHEKVYKPANSSFNHLLGIGSILHFASPSSIVWGSGLMSDRELALQPNVCDLDGRRIFAVRGYLTKNWLLENGVGINKHLPLGDPAVLMNEFYTPTCVDKKKYEIGIVPHYVDKNNPILLEIMRAHQNVKIIDVQQEAESFINDISNCNYILSSSLHGLILSDTYSIPNKWIRFSDKVRGGDFKFLDYYSTTDAKQSDCIQLDTYDEFIEIINKIESICRINKFTESKLKLILSFCSAVNLVKNR